MSRNSRESIISISISEAHPGTERSQESRWDAGVGTTGVCTLQAPNTSNRERVGERPSQTSSSDEAGHGMLSSSTDGKSVCMGDAQERETPALCDSTVYCYIVLPSTEY